MVPKLRREEILDFIKGKDAVYFDELAQVLGISQSTIRRDLMALEKQGDVVMMRGGAVRLQRENYDEPVIRKQMVHCEEKELIAKKAAALVQDGDYIYVDSGTTPVAMFRYLGGKNITIVSSSTQLMEYMPIRGATCILLGGEIREDLQSMVGALTEKEISAMFFDKAFLGVNGYVEDDGIYTYDPREARKKEIVKENSQQVYVLADTSKRNKKAFVKVFPYQECVLITERD